MWTLLRGGAKLETFVLTFVLVLDKLHFLRSCAALVLQHLQQHILSESFREVERVQSLLRGLQSVLAPLQLGAESLLPYAHEVHKVGLPSLHFGVISSALKQFLLLGRPESTQNRNLDDTQIRRNVQNRI